MRAEIERIWPEIAWVANLELREKVYRCWELAFERGPLQPRDLEQIPFTLLVDNCPSTFIEHKRCVVHIAKRSAEAMHEFLGEALPIDMDVVIAGAILADVGKLLEYEQIDGETVQSARGKALRHPFTGRRAGAGVRPPRSDLPRDRGPRRRGRSGRALGGGDHRAPRRLHELPPLQEHRVLSVAG